MNDSPRPDAAARRRASLDVARQVLRTEAQALELLANEMDEEAVGAALDLLLACKGRIVCTGMGKSGIIAKKLAGNTRFHGKSGFLPAPGRGGAR